MKKKQSNELLSLSKLLDSFVRDKGWQEQLELHSLFLRWPKLVDELTAAHSAPLKIIKKVLWVEVVNSAWLQQLQFQKHLMLERLNSALKGSKLEDIRFVLDDGKKKNPSTDIDEITFSAPPQQEQQAFAKQLEAIHDEKSREALMRLWYLSHACKRNE